MSTRATIGLKQSDGTITAIILWHDAYLDGAGRILQTHYDTHEKIERLMSGGNLEELGATPESSDYQYQGDDGVPDDCRATTLRSVDAFTHQVGDFGQDYGYLYQDGQWFHYRPGERLSQMQLP